MKHIVKRPLLTEKTLALASRGWYTFEVDKDATKERIKRAVDALFNVKVIDVRTISTSGKTRRVGRLMRTVATSGYKKALVRLASGHRIDAFEATSVEKK